MISLFLNQALNSAYNLSLDSFIFFALQRRKVFEQANRLVTKNSYYNLLEEKIEELVFTTVDSAKKQLAKLPRKENSSEF